MLLTLPFDATATLFRWPCSPAVLKVLAKRDSETASSLVRKSGVSLKTAWLLLKTLEKTEHTYSDGRRYKATELIEDSSITVNLRDRLSDSLFKRDPTRRIAYSIARRQFSNLKEMSVALNVPYRTVYRVVSDLKKCGVVSGFAIKDELLKEAAPLQLIPRKAHRTIVKDFLEAVRTFYAGFSEPAVFFGKASWGELLPVLNIMGLHEDTSPEGIHRFVKALVSAASNITHQSGVLFEIAVTSVDAWLAQSLNLVRVPHPLITEAMDGICIHGELPTKDEYFELMSRITPFTTQKIEELLEKGYVERVKDGKLLFTEKVLEKWRQNPDEFDENMLKINGKDVLLIILKPRGTPSY